MKSNLKLYVTFLFLCASLIILGSCSLFGGGGSSSITSESSQTSSVVPSSEVPTSIVDSSVSSESSSSIDTSIVVNKYLVNFDSDGGNDIDAIEVVEGEKANEPTPPIRSGYEFKGWLLNGQAFNFNTPITSNITLKAKWELITTDYSIDDFINLFDTQSYTMTTSFDMMSVQDQSSFDTSITQILKVDADQEDKYYFFDQRSKLNLAGNPIYGYMIEKNGNSYIFLLNDLYEDGDWSVSINETNPALSRMDLTFMDLTTENFIQREDSSIYDIILSEEQKYELLGYLPASASIEIYLDVSALTVTLRISLDEGPMMMSIDGEISFKDIGSTVVIYPVSLVKGSIDSYYLNSIEEAHELYLTESSYQNYVNLLNGFVNKLANVTDPTVMIEDFILHRTEIIDFPFVYDELASERGNSKKNITYQYEDYYSIATVQSRLELTQIYNNALAAVEASETLNEIYTIRYNFSNAVRESFVIDPVKAEVREYKEALIDSLDNYIYIIKTTTIYNFSEIKSLVVEIKEALANATSVSELIYIFEEARHDLKEIDNIANEALINETRLMTLAQLDSSYNYLELKEQVEDIYNEAKSYINNADHIYDMINMYYKTSYAFNLVSNTYYTSRFLEDIVNSFIITATNESEIELTNIFEAAIGDLNSAKSIYHVNEISNLAIKAFNSAYVYDPLKGYKSSVLEEFVKHVDDLSKAATQESIIEMEAIRNTYITNVENAVDDEEISNLKYNFYLDIEEVYVEDPIKKEFVEAKEKAIFDIDNYYNDMAMIIIDGENLYQISNITYQFMSLIDEASDISTVNALYQEALSLLEEVQINIDEERVHDLRIWSKQSIENYAYDYYFGNEYIEFEAKYKYYLELIDETFRYSKLRIIEQDANKYFSLAAYQIDAINYLSYDYNNYLLHASLESAAELKLLFEEYINLVKEANTYDEINQLRQVYYDELISAYVIDELQRYKNLSLLGIQEKEFYLDLATSESATALENLISQYTSLITNAENIELVQQYTTEFNEAFMELFAIDDDKFDYEKYKEYYLRNLEYIDLAYSRYRVYFFEYYEVKEIINEYRQLILNATSIDTMKENVNDCLILIKELDLNLYNEILEYERIASLESISIRYNDVSEDSRRLLTKYEGYYNTITTTNDIAELYYTNMLCEDHLSVVIVAEGYINNLEYLYQTMISSIGEEYHDTINEIYNYGVQRLEEEILIKYATITYDVTVSALFRVG